jgi:ribA/ribD-fused uncharacterized protein
MAVFFWKFRDIWGALSNFHQEPIEIGGLVWPTVEHFYQAMKTLDPVEREKIRNAETPYKSKLMGRFLVLRSDWESVKYNIMLTALREKFKNKRLRDLLLKTGSEEIYEDSPYDKIWGTGVLGEVGTGQNLLGNALMQIRNEINHLEG